VLIYSNAQPFNSFILLHTQPLYQSPRHPPSELSIATVLTFISIASIPPSNLSSASVGLLQRQQRRLWHCHSNCCSTSSASLRSIEPPTAIWGGPPSSTLVRLVYRLGSSSTIAVHRQHSSPDSPLSASVLSLVVGVAVGRGRPVSVRRCSPSPSSFIVFVVIGRFPRGCSMQRPSLPSSKAHLAIAARCVPIVVVVVRRRSLPFAVSVCRCRSLPFVVSICFGHRSSSPHP
jgi:hypothetical protein